MLSRTEGVHTGGFIVMESPGTISRDTVAVTVAALTTLAPGTVLGKLATGKYVPYDDVAGDGSDTAAGILYGEARNDTDAPVDVRSAIVNYSAEVRAADLIWSVDGTEAAGLVDLRALGIKARTE